ncbi:PREDICTED: spatacsin-like [Priapulus caudatus]|uniref:Spatacsin-like n=1 Tax=Priapulus caudatus TaxID=37621 RepID=A0ABM1DYP2_PRICU|nr:PREDICTED: spatacsin-like [Priapulus caudatus]
MAEGKLNDNLDKFSVPIIALEVGLKHWQLDTIEFFLKSKENELNGMGPDKNISIETGEELREIILILVNAVERNLTDLQTRSFANRLLSLSLNFLNKLMQILCECQIVPTKSADVNNAEGIPNEVGHVANLVMSSISRLRGSVEDLREEEDVGIPRSQCVPVYISDCNDMSSDEIVERAILSGRSPECQHYLYNCRGVDLLQLDKAIRTGLVLVLQSLLNRDILRASRLLTNMGFDDTSNLKKICMFTFNRPLREYLAQWLMQAGHLSSTEQASLTFLLQVEELYSCPSFANAKQMRLESEGNSWGASPAMRVLLTEATLIADVADCHLSQPDDVHVTHSESSAYSRLCLHWVQGWDAATRQKVLAERRLETASDHSLKETASGGSLKETASDRSLKETASGGSLKETSSDGSLKETASDGSLKETASDGSLKETASNGTWKETASDRSVKETASDGSVKETASAGSLKETASDRSVKETASDGSLKETASDGSLKETASDGSLKETARDDSLKETISDDVLWDYLLAHGDWPRLRSWIERGAGVTSSMADRLDDGDAGTDLLRERARDCLAARGRFSAGERRSFGLVLHRLVGARRLMADDSPHDAVFRRAFVEFCVAEILPHILYGYASRFALRERSPCFAARDLPDWVRMMLKFQHVEDFEKISAGEASCEAVSEASRANMKMLLGIDACHLRLMTEHGRPLLVLADLLYSSDNVCERLRGNLKEEETIRAALADYPKLLDVIFSNVPPDGSTSPDMTMYQLLQENCPFDVSRLFSWQGSNALRSQDDEERQANMPSFTTPALAQFAYQKELNFLYYLRHGRPSFAAVSFLTQDSGVLSGRGPSKAGTRLVCRKAYTLATRNFNRRTITAACAAFFEFLREDSSRLRIDVHAATLILAHSLAVAAPTTAEVHSANERACAVATPTTSEVRSANEHACAVAAPTKAEVRSANERACVGEIGRLLFALSRGDRDAGDALQARLGAATARYIEERRLGETSMEALEAWWPAALFAQAHDLPLPPDFLHACAERNHWFGFFVGAELHRYPRRSLDTAAARFHDPHLREHVQCAVRHARGGASERRRRREGRDLPEEEGEGGGMSTETRDAGSVIEHDVIAIVLSAQRSSGGEARRTLVEKAYATRSAAVALLASCFGDDDGRETDLDCLCVWLLCHLPASYWRQATAHISDGETHAWCLGDLSVIMAAAVESGNLKDLALAFAIFQNDSPMLPLLRFLVAFAESEDDGDSTKHIHAFKQAFAKFCREPRSAWADCAGDRLWFESIAVDLLKTFLIGASSGRWRVSRLLRCVVDNDLTAGFSSPSDADFPRALRVVAAATAADVDVAVSTLLRGEPAFGRECARALACMLGRHAFADARRFAEAAGIPSEPIVIGEATHYLAAVQALPVWQDVAARHAYWRSCSRSFAQSSLPAATAAAFFQEHAARCGDGGCDRVQLLQLTLHWLGEEDQRVNAYHTEELVYSQWLAFIRLTVKRLAGEDASERPNVEDVAARGSHARRDMVLTRERAFAGLHERGWPQREMLTLRERDALDDVVGALLDRFLVRDACQVALRFRHNSGDLAVVRTCMELAEGVTMPTEAMLGVAAETPRSMTRDASFSNLLPLPVVDADILSAMKTLTRRARHGRRCCRRVITCYQVASVLGRGYESVMAAPYFDVLRELLLTEDSAYFALAKDFVRGGGVDDAEMSAFLADAVISSLKIYVGFGGSVTSEISPRSSSELLFNPSDTSDSFCRLACLCGDTSRLGNLLLEAAAALARSDAAGRAAMSMRVELLIRAHDCYTACCHTEGISRVLAAARAAASALAAADEHALTTRLLTGVARYGEMTYVFDELQRQQQLILLLRKGVDKDPRLKVALLDHLERRRPRDRETYTMVALHFAMHREIAEMLEEAAYAELERYAARRDADDDRRHLQDIVQYFVDAAQSYAKEACLRHATACWHMARVVALQARLLPSRVAVVCLASPNDFIQTHPILSEAVVVANAYDCVADWTGALYHNAVVAGNACYVDDMRAARMLTPALVSGVCQRYLVEKSKTAAMAAHVKRLLEECCGDPLVKHRLASELGFTDVCADLLASSAGPYLKDRIGTS